LRYKYSSSQAMPPWWSDRLPVSPPTLPRLAAVQWTAVAAVLTWGVCLLLGGIRAAAARRFPSMPLEHRDRGEGIATGPHLAWQRAAKASVYAGKTAFVRL
jgi:hypothetical protein